MWIERPRREPSQTSLRSPDPVLLPELVQLPELVLRPGLVQLPELAEVVEMVVLVDPIVVQALMEAPQAVEEVCFSTLPLQH